MQLCENLSRGLHALSCAVASVVKPNALNTWQRSEQSCCKSPRRRPCHAQEPPGELLRHVQPRSQGLRPSLCSLHAPNAVTSRTEAEHSSTSLTLSALLLLPLCAGKAAGGGRCRGAALPQLRQRGPGKYAAVQGSGLRCRATSKQHRCAEQQLLLADHVAQVLDLYTGALQRLLRGHMDTISGLCYHPSLQVSCKAGRQSMSVTLSSCRDLVVDHSLTGAPQVWCTWRGHSGFQTCLHVPADAVFRDT